MTFSASPTYTFNNLISELYTIKVIDSKGCKNGVQSVSVRADNTLSLYAEEKNCHNTIVLTPTCGTVGSYQFSIDGIHYQESNKFDNIQRLLFGPEEINTNPQEITKAITCYVKDATGAIAKQDISIRKNTYIGAGVTRWNRNAERHVLLYPLERGDRIDKSVNTAGSIQIFHSDYSCEEVGGNIFIYQWGTYGGTPPYTYRISGPSIDQTVMSNEKNHSFQNLPKGVYHISGYDDNHCPFDVLFDEESPDTAFNYNHSGKGVEIKENILAFTTTSTPVLCNGEKGSILIEPIGGQKRYDSNSNYEFYYGITINGIDVPMTYPNPKPQRYKVNVDAGNYTIIVKNTGGCSVTKTATVTSPPVLTTTFIKTDVPCDGSGTTGRIVFEPNGGTPPYTYEVIGHARRDFTLSGTEPYFDNLAVGTYTGKVIDKNSCEAVFNTRITEEPPLTATINSQNNPTCGADGKITLNANGGKPPYQYTIDGGRTWQNNNIFDNLCPTYGIIKIKDNAGCEVILDNVILSKPDAIVVEEADGPILQITNPNLRSTAGDDVYTIIIYQGIEYKVGLPTHQKVAGSNNIIVDGKTYMPLFIKCSKTFAGYYDKNCLADPCTPTTKADYGNIDCLSDVPLKFQGKTLCKECWLDIVTRDSKLNLVDAEHKARFAKPGETLYIVRDPVSSRNTNLIWSSDLSGNVIEKHTEGYYIEEKERTANKVHYFMARREPPFIHKSNYTMDDRTINFETLYQDKKTNKEVGVGLSAETFNEFDKIVNKIAKSLKEQELFQIGTERVPCDADAQICLIIESEAGKETETEYAEEDNMPTYKHVKTEGDYISLATGLSRNFVPKKFKFDKEYFQVIPQLTVGCKTEGKFKSYKTYEKHLPNETDYITDNKFNNELSLTNECEVSGKLVIGAGLDGAISISGEAGVSVKATVLQLTYKTTTNNFSGQIGPVTVEPKGVFSYKIGFITHEDEFTLPYEIIKRIELPKF
jgi:hypothetical protein